MKPDPTIDAYDKYAEVYDEEVIDFWHNFPKSILRTFAQKLTGHKVLNLGSGSGQDALLLRDLDLEVVCLDASKSMVMMTRKLGFETHLANFKELNFPPQSFDGVWAYTSLIHIPPIQAIQAIKQIRKLLKPNGVFLIGAIEGSSAEMVERSSMPNTSRYFKFYGRDELKKLVEPMGFKLQYAKDYKPGSKRVYLNQLYRIDTEA